MKRIILLVLLIVLAVQWTRRSGQAWTDSPLRAPSGPVILVARADDAAGDRPVVEVRTPRRTLVIERRRTEALQPAEAPPAFVEAGELPQSTNPGHVTEGPTPRQILTLSGRQDPTGEAVARFQSLHQTIRGRISSSEERARHDARQRLEQRIGDWLARDVPRDWTPPSSMVDRLIVTETIEPQTRDFSGVSAILYVATLTVDLSPARRAEFVTAYNQQLVARRLTLLGGALAFLLACLAAVAGYIRADEATKGYYTNRLRLAVAVGVGAAGMAIYHMLA